MTCGHDACQAHARPCSHLNSRGGSPAIAQIPAVWGHSKSAGGRAAVLPVPGIARDGPLTRECWGASKSARFQCPGSPRSRPMQRREPGRPFDRSPPCDLGLAKLPRRLCALSPPCGRDYARPSRRPCDRPQHALPGRHATHDPRCVAGCSHALLARSRFGFWSALRIVSWPPSMYSSPGLPRRLLRATLAAAAPEALSLSLWTELSASATGFDPSRKSGLPAMGLLDGRPHVAYGSSK